jgi:hypothetical protein
VTPTSSAVAGASSAKGVAARGAEGLPDVVEAVARAGLEQVLDGAADDLGTGES